MVKYTVESAIGNDCSDVKMVEVNGSYASYMLHSIHNGAIDSIRYSNQIQENIVKDNLYCNAGDKVRKFNGSNEILGAMILKFKTESEILYKMDNMMST